MPATHRVKFSGQNAPEMKEGLAVALKIYNLRDGLDTAFRLIRKGEILPATAKVERLKDSREVVQVLSVDGKEAALQAIITDELNQQGPLCHFLAGWLAANGHMEEIPEDERKELEEAAKGNTKSLLERMRRGT